MQTFLKDLNFLEISGDKLVHFYKNVFISKVGVENELVIFFYKNKFSIK